MAHLRAVIHQLAKYCLSRKEDAAYNMEKLDGFRQHRENPSIGVASQHVHILPEDNVSHGIKSEGV